MSEPELDAAPRPRTALFLGGGAALVVLTLCVVGAAKNPMVRAFASGAMQKSGPADVRNPKTFTGARCSLRYPGNWVIDTSDEDYDPAASFSIDAPGQGSVFIQLFDPEIEPEALVESIADNLRGSLIQGEQTTRFELWGRQQGVGKQLSGTIFFMPGRFRLFSFRNERSTVVVMETRFNEDETLARAGFDLIEQSFELTPLLAQDASAAADSSAATPAPTLTPGD